jgi:Ulp1 family protease
MANNRRLRDPLLQPLTRVQAEAVHRAMSPKMKARDVVEAFNVTLRGSDMQCLREGEWLTDETVNFYLQTLRQQLAGRLHGATVHIYSTHFFLKLLERGTYNYANVKRWTSRIGGKCDVSSTDMLVFPIGLNGHWTLALVLMSKRKILYYDSKGGSGKHLLPYLLAYIRDELYDKKQIVLDANMWGLGSAQSVPQQDNDDDCGVFMVFFATYLVQGRPPMFAQCDVPHLRRLMAWCLLTAQAPPEALAFAPNRANPVGDAAVIAVGLENMVARLAELAEILHSTLTIFVKTK